VDLGQPTAEAVLLRCAQGIGGARLELRYPGGKPAVPTLARIVWQSGETRSVLAEPGATELTLPQPETARGVLRDYFTLGVQHILEGWDHLLFLVCLLLIARTPRRILFTVTGFTLGHAITITAVTLGLAGLAGPPVEAAIALSIMFLAAEIIKPHHGTLTWRHPVAISSAFGMLHGFGFASALREIGLPQTELPLALLAFNLGIETGQLIFVLGCALALFLLRSATVQRVPVAVERVGSGVAWAAGCTAAYWFVDRSLGLF
jgi:hydrogenase/urease accessory protein HupE